MHDRGNELVGHGEGSGELCCVASPFVRRFAPVDAGGFLLEGPLPEDQNECRFPVAGVGDFLVEVIQEGMDVRVLWLLDSWLHASLIPWLNRVGKEDIAVPQRALQEI